MMRALLCLCLSAGLCACGSLGPSAQPRTEVDAAKMAAVERAAVRGGVKVYWIQPPTRAVPVAGS